MPSSLFTEFRQWLSVTKEDAELAIRRNSKSCMVAEAIKRQKPEWKNPHVDVQTIRFTLGEKRYVFFTPKICQESITQFEFGIKPTPFRFKLQDPCQILKSKSGEQRVRTNDNNQKRAILNGNGSVVV